MGLLLASAVAWSGEGSQTAAPANSRQEGASRSVRVQGGSGLAPVAGAPSPAPPGPMGSGPVAVRTVPPARGGALAAASFKVLALKEGEATLEIGGARRTVKPGERLGRDTVRAVAPDQIVLERAAARADAPPVLVVVTFGDNGRPHTRVIHTKDDTAPAAPEVKRP